MMRRIKIILGVGSIWFCLLPLLTAAQTDAPATPTPVPTTATENPTAVPQVTVTPVATPTAEVEIPKVHVVQEGEVLVGIAEQYETTAEAIQILNNLSNPDALYVGQELLIPGVSGEGVPLFYTVEVGDTLESIAAVYSTTVNDVAALNHLVSTADLYAGALLSLVSRTGTAEPQQVSGVPHVVKNGDTLLSIAAAYNASPADVAAANGLRYPVRLFAGQQLRIPVEGSEYRYLSDGWLDITMEPESLGQGSTAAIYVAHALSGTPNGQLVGPEGQSHALTFVPYEDGYLAFVGLDSFAPSGRYTLTLGGEGVQRPWLPFTQQLIVPNSTYGLQQITLPDELAPLLAPEIRATEDEYLDQIFTVFTPEKQWEGVFQAPVSNTIITAGYGDARSYNGGPVEIFHTGIDFGGSAGTPILAPAAGTVVFTGTLTLRGETVIIDHGLGIMTAYYHLSRLDVKVGDVVTAGQKVAEGGSTGLSTGPHLHWDLRVMGTAVNPVQWLERPFP